MEGGKRGVYTKIVEEKMIHSERSKGANEVAREVENNILEEKRRVDKTC